MCGVRVHAVLLQTERVAGEEHDHRTTSRTNLVDLAGSERCGSAQTSGEQLKVRAPLPPRGASPGRRWRGLTREPHAARQASVFACGV